MPRVLANSSYASVQGFRIRQWDGEKLKLRVLGLIRQQISVYLFFFLVFHYVFGVADANFEVSFRVVSTVLKIFATN